MMVIKNNEVLVERDKKEDAHSELLDLFLDNGYDYRKNDDISFCVSKNNQTIATFRFR